MLFILSLIALTACAQKETKSNTVNTYNVKSVTNDTTVKKVTSYKVNRKAILIGENIKLLDENFKVIKDISYLNEQFVEVIAVGTKYHKAKPTDDDCQQFKYIKIKTKELQGYVDGRKLFEPIKNAENKILKIDKNEVSFIATTYFGIGVSDDKGLTFCSMNTPVVFADKNAKYEGIVKMVKNKNYQSNYPYFELITTDVANDEILSIALKEDKYLLKIKRIYQEGEANLLISIYKEKNGTFVAEILENVPAQE